jgi:hypothetical protein
VSWFQETVEVEAPPDVAEDRKAQLERERTEAIKELKAAAEAEKAYKDAHPQHPFPVHAENSVYIQTRVDDLERKRLESAVRKCAARFYEALRQVAKFENPDLVL